jgi:peptidoglycan/xylan/chitin deacetylase (PgdA/CDA1 family)
MPVKKLIKTALYNALRFSGYLNLRNLYLRTRGKTWCAVLLYHRVDPELQNDPIDINIHPEKFRQQIEIFAKRYNVLTVAEMLGYLNNNKPFPPNSICITFDDSYKSIYDHAIPVLKEFNLPACFFLNDGYLGTERTYPWDNELEAKQAMMSWDEARDILSSGFEVGVHTTNHLDLGTLDKEKAETEIYKSRQVLEHELEGSFSFFSIPFGKKENFTDETISIIKAGDFSCNFSAYGGFVDSGSDIYNLLRIPFSDDYWSVNELCADIDRVF